MKKLLCLLLCLVMCFALLAGCKRKKEEESTESEETPEASASILVADLANYTVVFPESASTEVEQAAKSVAEAINEKFSTQLTVKNDFYVDRENSRYTIGEYEILVGTTNRPETTEFTDTLRYDDYGYTLIGKKLVITGIGKEETVKAAEAFIEDCITPAASDAEVFFESSSSKTVKGEYRHTELTLGGANISEYRIVYPAGANFEKALATKISYSLAYDCGVLPKVVADSEEYADGYEILVGKTNRSADTSAVAATADGQGYVGQDGNFAILAGNTAWGTASAVNKFISCYQGADASETLDVTLENSVITFGTSNLTAMSFNVNGSQSTDSQLEAIVGAIVAELPDTVGIQEAGNALFGLKTALGAYYEFVGDGNNAILFAKDKYNKVDGAAEETGYTWATVERKSDGLKYMHINTKLDESSASARSQMADLLLEVFDANSDTAIIFTGDLACATNSAEFKLFVSGNMRDCSFIAQNSTNNGSGNIVDYVIADDYYIDVISYKRASNICYEKEASDHCPITVEFKIDYNGTSVKTESSEWLTIGRDNNGNDFKYPVEIY